MGSGLSQWDGNESEDDRIISGTLQSETDAYYQLIVDSVENKIGKADWKKGDLIKVSKDLVKKVSYGN